MNTASNNSSRFRLPTIVEEISGTLTTRNNSDNFDKAHTLNKQCCSYNTLPSLKFKPRNPSSSMKGRNQNVGLNCLKQDCQVFGDDLSLSSEFQVADQRLYSSQFSCDNSVDSSIISTNNSGLYRDSSTLSDLNSVNLSSVWQQSISSPPPSIGEQDERDSLSVMKSEIDKKNKNDKRIERLSTWSSIQLSVSSKTSSSKKSSTYKSLSISPISIDGIDLANLIRVSPNSLNTLYQEFLNTSPDMTSILVSSSTSDKAKDHEYITKSSLCMASSPANISNQNLGHCFNVELENSKPHDFSKNLYVDPIKEPNKIIPFSVNNCYSIDYSQYRTKDSIYNDFQHLYPGNCYSSQCNIYQNPTVPEKIYTSLESVPFSKIICYWIDCYHSFLDCKSLVNHIEKIHVDQRNIKDEYTCFWQGCSRKLKPFNARYKLLIHMRVHSGEKPNKCKYIGCDKAFSRLENLKIHERSHTGERPYQCQYIGCPKAFSNSSDRAKHQRTHYDTKPYCCGVSGCGKRYTDPSSLRKHIKSHQTLQSHINSMDQCLWNPEKIDFENKISNDKQIILPSKMSTNTNGFPQRINHAVRRRQNKLSKRSDCIPMNLLINPREKINGQTPFQNHHFTYLEPLNIDSITREDRSRLKPNLQSTSNYFTSQYKDIGSPISYCFASDEACTSSYFHNSLSVPITESLNQNNKLYNYKCDIDNDLYPISVNISSIMENNYNNHTSQVNSWMENL